MGSDSYIFHNLNHILRILLSVDFYTDGCYADNDKTVDSCRLGVLVHNSAALGDHYGAFSDSIQTNNRAALEALEVALQLG